MGMKCTYKLGETLQIEASRLGSQLEAQQLQSRTEGQILAVREWFKKIPRDEWFRDAHQLVDALVVKSLEGKQEPTCTGCTAAYCCNQHIVTCREEVKYILSQTDNLAGIELDRDLLAKQIAFEDSFGEGYQDKLVHDWVHFEHNRCVFLDKDNKCQIYAVRPLTCRLHYSVDPAVENCLPDHLYQAHIVRDGEVVMSAVMQMNRMAGMAKILKDLGIC